LFEFISSEWERSKSDDKVAIIDGTTDQRRTFLEYQQYSTSIAAALKSNFDVNEKSTVVLFSPNDVDYIPITLAVSLCGAKLSPVNPLFKSGELRTILKQCRADIMIVHAKIVDVALEAVKECSDLKHILVIPDPTFEGGGKLPVGTINLEDLKFYNESLDRTVRQLHNDPFKHPVLLPFSSGTTGLPKAVCLSHSNLVQNLVQIDEIEALGFPSVSLPYDFTFVLVLSICSTKIVYIWNK